MKRIFNSDEFTMIAMCTENDKFECDIQPTSWCCLSEDLIADLLNNRFGQQQRSSASPSQRSTEERELDDGPSDGPDAAFQSAEEHDVCDDMSPFDTGAQPAELPTIEGLEETHDWRDERLSPTTMSDFAAMSVEQPRQKKPSGTRDPWVILQADETLVPLWEKYSGIEKLSARLISDTFGKGWTREIPSPDTLRRYRNRWKGGKWTNIVETARKEILEKSPEI